ncbi:hypothetical protein LguiA_017401 [Lonicera macranthoides]
MTSSIVSKSSCNWHPSHEEAFVQLLEEEFDMGRMGMNNTLSAKQVNEISNKLKERIGRVFNAQQIKAKFNRIKVKTNAFHKLINTTNFGWSTEIDTVTAEENVWTTYLKVNPIATSTQGPPNYDEERDMGGGPSMFAIGDVNVHGSGGKGRSSKRTMTSLNALIETMSETSRAKRAHYDAKATYVDEHTMADCMTVLSNMLVPGAQYALAAEKSISGKDWRTFFLLSYVDRQLEWVNGLK